MNSPTITSSSTTSTRPDIRGARASIGRRAPTRAVPESARASSSGGKRTRNVAPAPGAESTVTCPPHSCTMPCTVDSPMPEPLPTPLVVKNGSKIRSSASGAMPDPESRTASVTNRPWIGLRHDAHATPACSSSPTPHRRRRRSRSSRRAR